MIIYIVQVYFSSPTLSSYLKLKNTKCKLYLIKIVGKKLYPQENVSIPEIYEIQEKWQFDSHL